MEDLSNDHDANGHHSPAAAAGERRCCMDPLGETMKAGNTSAQRLQSKLLAGDDDCDSNNEVGVPRIISYLGTLIYIRMRRGAVPLMCRRNQS